MNDFFKSFNIRGGFSTKSILSDKKTVCIKHKNGRITEHEVTNPWRYIKKVKKEMNVVSAWLKEE